MVENIGKRNVFDSSKTIPISLNREIKASKI
jgi:hypothetical protein